MSKISNLVKSQNKENREKAVLNFMGGKSFKLNPIDTLKMVAASSIFGEPAYYRDGIKEKNNNYNPHYIPIFNIKKEKTSNFMERIIDEALDYNFKETLELAITLRLSYNMRLNPQIIMVRASIHPKRVEFTSQNEGEFNRINSLVMRRADEPASQAAYYIYLNGGKSKIPNILKRSWAKKLESLNKYQVNKYKNHEIGMIDTVRLCHANSPVLSELMKTGKVSVEDDTKTWENLRSEGLSWVEILNTIKIPHMALLRNLRGIFTEINNEDLAKDILNYLKSGVLVSKQFPFRYKSAYNAVEKSNINFKSLVLKTLEECMDISLDNMPKLKGKTICLSDNSGSAWGTFNSEYGSQTVANIGNLSSVITAKNSEDGYVGVFGDKLEITNINKRNGVLSDAKHVDLLGSKVGEATENGLWLFFKDAINNKVHWDNVFIYSDMQAGRGQLYGKNKSEYIDYSCNGHYIDLHKLIDKYKSEVNPKLNVYAIQTAGYDNIVIPEYYHRLTVLTGWTGKELLFASEINEQWNKIEDRAL